MKPISKLSLTAALLCGGSVALAASATPYVEGTLTYPGGIVAKVQPDANGDYQFSKLAPGKYQLCFAGQACKTVDVGKDGMIKGKVPIPPPVALRLTTSPPTRPPSTGPVAGVHTIEGIETESDVVEYKDGEDGVNRTRPGNHGPGKMISQTIIVPKDGSFKGQVPQSASAGVSVPVKPAIAFNLQRGFSLEIAGLPAAPETRIEGLQEALGKAQSSAKAGGGNGTSPKPGKITITKDWSNTLEWYTWRKKVMDGKTDRRSVSIIFHDDAGAEVGRMNFYNCWPTQHVMPATDAQNSGPATEHVLPSFNAKNSGHATEQIELAYEDVRLN